MYFGNFADSNMNGFGFLRYKDRQSYLGYFKNGMYNGIGVRTFPDGSKVCQEEQYMGLFSIRLDKAAFTEGRSEIDFSERN